MTGTRMTSTGPFFHPAEMRTELGRATDAIQLDIGKYGYRWIHQFMRGKFQHPSGYYESRVIVDVSAGNVVLTDHGVIYGAWLEGISHRNDATRFKGYAMFRRAGQAMEAAAPSIATATLKPYLRRFG